MSDEDDQAFPEIDHVTIQRCDGEGKVISLRITTDEEATKRARVAAWAVACIFFSFAVIASVFLINMRVPLGDGEHGITRLWVFVFVLAGAGIVFLICMFVEATTETVIQVDTVAKTLSVNQIFLAKYSTTPRVVSIDDIIRVDVDTFRGRGEPFKVISILPRRGDRFLIYGIADLSDVDIQKLAEFLYKQCTITSMLAGMLDPIPQESTKARPSACPTCDLPLAGKSKRQCARCGIWWCMSCGRWNVPDRERCEECSFMRPSD